jgi:hypothetical protein
MAAPLLRPERRWMCPNCPATDVTHDARPHTRFHPCPGLRGLTAPMVPAGSRARVHAVEREDYVGSEHPQTDGEGRPVMAVVTTREDGQDVAILAPVARGAGHGVDC